MNSILFNLVQSDSTVIQFSSTGFNSHSTKFNPDSTRCHMVAEKMATNSSQNWDSCIQVQDWKGKVWTLNYTKQYVRGEGWSLDWEVLDPQCEVKVSSQLLDKVTDTDLAQRCRTSDGLIDEYWLWHEFKTWVRHYTNVIDIKKLKAEQAEHGREVGIKKPRQLPLVPRSKKEP